ncbi:MAG: cytochrome C biogenesis protein CcsA [Magnetospirillum sp. WYHS-4]
MIGRISRHLSVGGLASVAAVVLGVLSAPAAGQVELRQEPIRPIPLNHDEDQGKVDLGRRLFADKRLSTAGDFSCTQCHDFSLAGIDGRARARFREKEGERNVPTIFNTRYNVAQVWDGRFLDVEADIEATVASPHSFASHWPSVVDRLRGVPEYAEVFSNLYREGLTKKTVIDAVAVYLRALTTPNSRFDRYLRGDEGAIGAEEKEGYALFKSYGCIACHQGAAVGGNMFQRFGVLGDYFADKAGEAVPDLGRYNVTGHPDDRFAFKVPSLRLVVRTAPYLHDGSVATLEEAIRIMAKYQLGRAIPAEHIHLIVRFLESLVGEHGGKPL